MSVDPEHWLVALQFNPSVENLFLHIFNQEEDLGLPTLLGLLGWPSSDSQLKHNKRDLQMASYQGVQGVDQELLLSAKKGSGLDVIETLMVVLMELPVD